MNAMKPEPQTSAKSDPPPPPTPPPPPPSPSQSPASPPPPPRTASDAARSTEKWQAARRRWSDKFAPVTLETLLEDLGEHRAAAEQVRALLLADESVAEGISWEGIAWCWSLVYTRPGDATRAWAYLIPDPEEPQVCVPLPASAVERIRVRRLKKPTREAVARGKLVGGVCWVSVALTGPAATGVEEVEELLRAKREED